MEDLTGQLAELLEDITYDFSAHNLSTNCCENISHGEFRALRAVSRRDGCTMQDIARNIAVTKSGATRIVSRLEEKNLSSACRSAATPGSAASGYRRMGKPCCPE